MEIRQARPSDLDGVRDCAAAAYDIYVPRMGKRPAPMVADFERQIGEGIVHVLADNGAIAGYAVFYPRGDHVHLENVAVHPNFQHKGLGVRLISYVEQSAARSGAIAVELYTNEKMTENLALYPHLGYEEIGRWSDDGFDRVYFRKVLVELER